MNNKLTSAGLLVAALLVSSASFAQVKIGANPTTISSNANLDVEDNLGRHMVVLNNGNVGIGIAAPVVKLNVENGNFSVNQGADNAFTGTIQASAAIGSGNTNRSYYSLTVGQNNVTDGQNSLAIGFQNFTGASGNNSFSYGQTNQSTGANSISGGFASFASGLNSIAIGHTTQATANSSAAFGQLSEASANFAFATGYNNKARGEMSTAMGRENLASGYSSVALGWGNQATDAVGIALGYFCSANGNTSIAMGKNAKAFHASSVVISDGTGADFGSFGNNTISMRFSSGYRFYTNAAHSTGVLLGPSATSWGSISDIRAKKDISGIENGLSTIMKLQPKKYHYKNSDNKQFSLGFIAQEVVKVLPEIVDVPENKEEYLSIRYSELVPVLTKAIQEQQTQIAEQKAEITNLKAQISQMDKLEAKLADLEAKLAGGSGENSAAVTPVSK
ncbi:tail fiber domain-containing protein [Dyadobacter alkalitolerans]|uniref:tail fiber domain-containing protein n=1 Tax=Dyadobacter alkalitolerans TaxID=492736 RepID=UPI00047AA6CB|nr:tail fiber domain-containing protein [Dyadobacter alkalitolerans]